MDPLPAWQDGQLLPGGEATLGVHDSSLLAGQACYTSSLVQAGRARYAGRHVERLVRDARALGFEAPDPQHILHAFAELGRRAFGDGPGIVRVQASQGEDGRCRLLATARRLGPDAFHWQVFTYEHAHPGPGPWPGVKRSGEPHLAAARAAIALRDLDETLLVDREGYMVEGARSSFVLIDARGERVTPSLERGGVRSIARDILLEVDRDLKCRNISAASLKSARAIVAVNAVRGARPVMTLDGRPLERDAGERLASWATRILDAA